MRQALGVEVGDKPAFSTYLAASGLFFAYLAHGPWPEGAFPCTVGVSGRFDGRHANFLAPWPTAPAGIETAMRATSTGQDARTNEFNQRSP